MKGSVKIPTPEMFFDQVPNHTKMINGFELFLIDRADFNPALVASIRQGSQQGIKLALYLR